MLGLTPAAFRRLTPAEFLALQAGYVARLTAPGGTAWLAAVVLNALGARLPWSAHTVLGLPPPAAAEAS